jgi:hypothetical protein
MSFFQNVFDFEFRPTLFGADRQYQMSWKLPANANRSDYMLSGNAETYNLSAAPNLTINYAYDPDFKNYSSLTVNVAGATAAATKASEVVAALNANATFASLFSAVLYPSNKLPGALNKVLIKGLRSRGNFRAYISNTSAETIIGFNKNAPVRELPSLFEKYTITNLFAYPNLGPDRIILLDPGVTADAAIITAAGFNPASPTPDWELLAGLNDAFWFYKRTYSSGVLTTEIKYPAGASAGDLAKKTYYTYSGSDLIEVMETPYVLQSGDLITPP